MPELAASRIHGKLIGMSLPSPPVAAAQISSAELRRLLHADVDRLHDADLAAAHQAALDLIMQRALRAASDAMDEAWESGAISDERIEAAKLEHRCRHPYR